MVLVSITYSLQLYVHNVFISMYVQDTLTDCVIIFDEFSKQSFKFTNYGIYFKQRLPFCLHLYNKLHNVHRLLRLINTIELSYKFYHFLSSLAFSLILSDHIFAKIHKTLQPMYRFENTFQTTIKHKGHLVQAQLI